MDPTLKTQRSDRGDLLGQVLETKGPPNKVRKETSHRKLGLKNMQACLKIGDPPFNGCSFSATKSKILFARRHVSSPSWKYGLPAPSHWVSLKRLQKPRYKSQGSPFFALHVHSTKRNLDRFNVAEIWRCSEPPEKATVGPGQAFGPLDVSNTPVAWQNLSATKGWGPVAIPKKPQCGH